MRQDTDRNANGFAQGRFTQGEWINTDGFSAYRDTRGVLYWQWSSLILRFPAARPYVAGILNVTPDSFSDGGAYGTVEVAVAHGKAMAEEGADIIDVGGQSTRPGYAPVDLQEEKDRVLPVLRALSALRADAAKPVLLSLDTDKPAMAEAVLQEGLAHMLNDESGGNPAMAEVAARYGVPLILMHRPGAAGRGSIEATREDLALWRDQYIEAGLPGEWIALDPGIGFGKDDNVAILRECARFLDMGAPLYIGASRKGFIGKATGNPDASKRLGGSLAAALWAAEAGASFVRVHDVRETVEALSMWAALRDACLQPNEAIGELHGEARRDKILLEGMRFFGYHGWLPAEQTLGQWFEVDLELTVDLSLAGASDDIAFTVDYSKIYADIKAIAEGPPMGLIEALAAKMAKACFVPPQVQAVTIRVKKPQVALGGPLAYSAVEISRRREDLEPSY